METQFKLIIHVLYTNEKCLSYILAGFFGPTTFHRKVNCTFVYENCKKFPTQFWLKETKGVIQILEQC